MAGTKEFAHPKQNTKNNEYGYEVDVWALGAIFYSMIVGYPPIWTKDMEAAREGGVYYFPKAVSISFEGLDLLTSMLQLEN